MVVDGSTPQRLREDLTQEAFDRLLAWLDRDRDRAGYRYEEIRSRLIKIFVCRGCAEPEELADETINRVARKIHEISDNYVGDPALYFYGVAQMVHREHLRKKRDPLPLPSPSALEQEVERRYECLEECMERLSSISRELILAYYGEEKQAKIDRRRELAEQLGIGANALWIRAHRIRESLRECVSKCLTHK